MKFDLDKNLNVVILLLITCLGLVLGAWLAAWIGVQIAPAPPAEEQSVSRNTQVSERRLDDFSSVYQQNLFNPGSTVQPEPSAGLSETLETTQQPAAAPPKDLKLLGTVAGGATPLAVILVEKQSGVFRVGELVARGLTLTAVARDRATVSTDAGVDSILELIAEKNTPKKKVTSRKKKSSNSKVNIVELGDNHWQIPREEAEKARSNLNTLLKTARMVPKIKDGETEGFTIVSIQPGTFLDLLGLRVGDTLVQINQVELNSPEKALQIFQQVREANNITLGLLRNSSRKTFEYTID